MKKESEEKIPKYVMIPQILDSKSKFILIPLKPAPQLWTSCAMSVAPRFNKGGKHCWAAQPSRWQGGSGSGAPAANGFSAGLSN